ncbi:hypothetical protein ACROYT_G030774 [Oculina patagonica]
MHFVLVTQLNMAENSAKAASMARVLAIVHIIVGFLLLCFGIADAAVGYFVIGDFCLGIFYGVWMIIAGGLGIPGTRKERSTSRNAFAGIFMGFSITSALFSVVIIAGYSISISFLQYDYRNDFRDDWWGTKQEYRRNSYHADMVINTIILILSVVEFVIGIWAAVCLCLLKPCTCCYRNLRQEMCITGGLGIPGTRKERTTSRNAFGQVIYTANTGYVINQGPGGAPVTIPMEAGGSMVAVQGVTPGAQGGQPHMVIVPVSSAGGFQPQLGQVAPTGAMATGYQPQQAEMPPSYEQVQCMTQQDAQITVKT